MKVIASIDALALTALQVLNFSDTRNTLRVNGDLRDTVTSLGQGWLLDETVTNGAVVLYFAYALLQQR